MKSFKGAKDRVQGPRTWLVCAWGLRSKSLQPKSKVWKERREEEKEIHAREVFEGEEAEDPGVNQ